jgi:histidyl-tRNA synthetase
MNYYSLRPEGTASIVRSYIENNLDKKESFSKLFYVGPMFRGERPQKGRLRQFHQIGVEAMGPNSSSPYLDAEVIALCMYMLSALGLKDVQLKINTLGTPEDKQNFSTHLREQLKPHLKEFCEDCQNRFDRNVFRILDCKNRGCQAVVNKIDLGDSYLSADSKKYFEEVKAALKGLGIKFEHSPHLVRGLDYYTHTVFEISSASLGSQDALGAGGRYNNLVSQLGGPAVDAVGFALGVERILLAMPKDSALANSSLDAYLIALDEPSLKKGFGLLESLRQAVYELKTQNKIQKNFSIDMGFRLSSLKSQMRSANDRGARFVMILGENELKREIITLKDMANGQQEEKSLKDIDNLAKKLIEGSK